MSAWLTFPVQCGRILRRIVCFTIQAKAGQPHAYVRILCVLSMVYGSLTRLPQLSVYGVDVIIRDLDLTCRSIPTPARDGIDGQGCHVGSWRLCALLPQPTGQPRFHQPDPLRA